MCQDGGALLCAVDEAHDHSISVWDWQKGDKGYKITETKVSSFNQYHKIKRKLFVSYSSLFSWFQVIN